MSKHINTNNSNNFVEFYQYVSVTAHPIVVDHTMIFGWSHFALATLVNLLYLSFSLNITYYNGLFGKYSSMVFWTYGVEMILERIIKFLLLEIKIRPYWPEKQ